MTTRPESSDAPAPEKGKKDAPRTNDERIEDRIDESLEESFPASDPPAVHTHKKK